MSCTLVELNAACWTADGFTMILGAVWFKKCNANGNGNGL
jgi:hypothetical protein